MTGPGIRFQQDICLVLPIEKRPEIKTAGGNSEMA
jgi:hypothetical protein